MAASTDLRIRWVLDVVDRGGPAKLLKADRALRRGLEQTDRTYKRLSTSASGAGTRMTQASARVARAHGFEGRALRGLSSEATRAARGIDQTAAANRRAASTSDRVVTAYKQQARAAKEVGRAEATRAKQAQRSSAAGGAVAAGAAGGRLVRSGAALGLAATAAAGAGAIKIFAGFEEQMDKVAAVSGASRRQLALLEAQAKSLGASTNFSNREVAAAMDELARAGFSVQDIMKTIPGTLNLAAASGTDLADSAAIQAAQLRAFGLEASKSTHVADVLATAVNKSAIDMSELADTMSYVAPVAGQFNQSFEDVAAAAAILGNVGIAGSKAGTSLRRMFTSVVKPSDKTLATLKEAGISTKDFAQITQDAQGKLRPFPQMIGRLSGALEGVDLATRRKTLAQLFGTEALPGMLTLVGKGQGAIERMADSLRNSDGAAKRTAKTMRDNVAGAFDQFTGSVETAATTLVERFGPSIKKGLLAAAGGITGATGVVSDFLKGATGGTKPPAQVSRAAARTEGLGRARPQTPATSGAENVGAKARQIGGDIVGAVKSAVPVVVAYVKQLIDAFRPALPFFQNVLLPLLKGFGQGLLISVVGALKLAVPIIKIFATALGAIGTVLRPFRGAFQAVGLAIGVLATGPLTKLAGGLGKIGTVFRVLNAPIKLVAGAFGIFGRGMMGALRIVTRFNPAVVAVRLAILKIPVAIANVAGRAAGAARSVAGGIVKAFEVVGKIPGKVIDALGGIAGKLAGVSTKLASSFFRFGWGLVKSIGTGIRRALAVVTGFFSDLKPKFDISLNPLHPKFHLSLGPHKIFRRGGRARRYADGGLVPSFVSSGEQIIEPGGASWMVPGAPVAADNVFAMLTPGSAVLTGDGQARMAAGMSLSRVLATQAPHFAKGGRVGASMYGGPGDPTTKKPERGYKGDYLEHAPNTFAELGNGHALGGLPYRAPITVTYRGRSLVVRKRDIGKGGGDVNGRKRAIDLYYRAAAKLRFRGLGVVNWVSGSRRGTTGASADKTVPLTLGRSATRAGLIDDAFTTSLENKRSGTSETRAEFLSGLRSSLRQVQTTRTVSTGSSSGGSSSGGAYNTSGAGTTRMDGKPVASWIARILKRARADGTRFRVSSGFRSRAEQTRLWNKLGQDPRIVARPGTSNHEGAKYPRGAVDLSPGWQNMVGWLRKHPNAPIKHYGEPRDPYHFSASGHRRGGRIRRFAAGGKVGPTLTKAVSSLAASQAGSLDRFARIVDDALSSRLEALRKQLLAKIRKGGDAKVIARLQAALSIIDRALGARIGKTLRLVDQTKSRVEVAGTAIDRLLRIYGVDASSSTGLTAVGMYVSTVAIPAAQKNVARLQRAIDAAKRAGQTQTARDLKEELKTAIDDLAELFTSQVERFRDIVRAAAQERVDATQFWTEFQQNNLAGLDVFQRISGTTDTPAAMIQRAQAIQSLLIPALQQSVAELRQQNLDLLAIGDMNGARAAFLAMQQAGLDLASATADAADLLKQAAETAAQDVVDAAGHRKNLADLGLARLELEQRLAGTYDTGAGARAEYIKSTLIPALESELSALQAQATTAAQQGDQKLADQIAEAIASKQNDILQAQVDSLEQIEQNTTPKGVGGTLGFQYGNENLNDALITIGNGS